MSIRGWGVVLGAACAGDPDHSDDVVTGTTDIVVPPVTDSGTPYADTCFAVWEVDRGDDGFADGVGRVIYDPVRIDLPVHTEIYYSDDELWADDNVYDAGGYLVRYAHDEGIDGIEDFVSTYTRDADGRVLVREVDYDGNGVADEVLRSTYDDAGNLVTYSEDEHNDGDLDYAYTNLYGEDGLRSEVLLDEDGDGTINVWYTYTYDAVGRWTEFAGDRGDDGTIDSIETATYTDPVLLVGITVVDRQNDDDPEFVREFTYDAAERPLLIRDDEDADGFFDRQFVAVYDAVTGLVLTSYEQRLTPPPDDGNRNEVAKTYLYDEAARLIEHTSDYAFVEPGIAEYTLTHQWWTFGGICP